MTESVKKPKDMFESTNSRIDSKALLLDPIDYSFRDMLSLEGI